jgi:IS4 transposase
MGYTHFQRFAQLTLAQVTWMTRAKSNLVYTLESVIAQSSTARDHRIRIGSREDSQTVRLIEMYFEGEWHRYLTNELDPVRLPAVYAVMLYRQRWRIEEAFLIVKRLLGLSSFWCGAQNAVELQIWATWL